MGELALRDIVKSFGHIEVVKRVSLDVREGEFVVFVGPSGCGKSTLLRMIAGLERITAGEISIDGARVNDLPPVQRGIAMVFQSYALYPHMTVFENMAFPLRVERAKEDESAARSTRPRASCTSKSGCSRSPASSRAASGSGWRSGAPSSRAEDLPLRRAAVEPRRRAARRQRIEIARLHKQLGATMIYVTHDQIEAMTMADRIVVLNGGRSPRSARRCSSIMSRRTYSSRSSSATRR